MRNLFHTKSIIPSQTLKIHWKSGVPEHSIQSAAFKITSCLSDLKEKPRHP